MDTTPQIDVDSMSKFHQYANIDKNPRLFHVLFDAILIREKLT